MTFYARLKTKVQLCRYSPNDQERFVRSQLLKGMTNRELAKAARTFGYDAAFVVQSASRSEAFGRESSSDNISEGTVQEVSRTPNTPRSYQRPRPFGQRPNRNTDYNNQQSSRAPFRNNAHPRGRLGKRGRCSRCDRPAHKGEECPAKTQDCYRCGMRGHFAVTCRRKEANVTEELHRPRTENNTQV